MNEEFNVKSDCGFINFSKISSEFTKWELVNEDVRVSQSELASLYVKSNEAEFADMEANGTLDCDLDAAMEFLKGIKGSR
ncbi:hypothetical protein I6H07_06330 [Hafnia alvei]|uniref:hypothetical protein n=1 Tax=Hafnia alvei TaxID=569 RepID=UPI000B74FB4C|nr:hypothetical protein [Hafnia alvei]MBI0275450.1 hypothetical protein [Hafnia alvei]PNK98555.1 hypothetical protein CEQ28_013655 [Hafnia alvei]